MNMQKSFSLVESKRSEVPAKAGIHYQQAFSLVELSIVLVILGLLTGGILAGQSLIRAAELRSVIAEYQRYSTAAQTFRDKYMAIPGDMTNATSFWGKDNTNCSGNTGTAATPGTCNGNGNGAIDMAAGTGQTAEIHQFWKQLALAGIIEGNYTGLAGPNAIFEDIPGTNVPRSKFTNAGWGMHYGGVFPGLPNYAFAADQGNMFVFGAYGAGTYVDRPALKAEEAWNIDTKLDDGKPATGRIMPNFYSTSTTGTSVTDTNAAYLLTSSNVVCAIYFNRQF